ncbi:hypothetical protein M9458_044164, partial [Cirrhinus mrigala]
QSLSSPPRPPTLRPHATISRLLFHAATPIMDTLHTTMAVATHPTLIPKHSPHGRSWSVGVRMFPHRYHPKALRTCQNQTAITTP